MSFSEIELPSNKKFGFFFSFVFVAVAFYCWSIETNIGMYISGTVALTFCVISIVKPNFLLPLNRLWLSLGMFLGKIVGPIVLGIIFYGIFSPIGLAMRLFGRDELRLKVVKKPTHWVLRSTVTTPETFKQQF